MIDIILNIKINITIDFIKKMIIMKKNILIMMILQNIKSKNNNKIILQINIKENIKKDSQDQDLYHMRDRKI